MKASSGDKVREFYQESSDWYSSMMDSEIDLPIYAETLGRLASRIENISGPVIDTSCGPGHMLSRYHEIHDPKRALIAVDLSPKMTELARKRLGTFAEVFTGDMRDLNMVGSESSAGVLSFFAIHHLDPEEVIAAFDEWNRVLVPEGKWLSPLGKAKAQLTTETNRVSSPFDTPKKNCVNGCKSLDSP